MTNLNAIAQRPDVQAALNSFNDIEAALEQIIAIQQIPAPTFDEEQRARYIEGCFQSIGLTEVSRDPLNNVYGCSPGSVTGRPALIISAHLDTVFPKETDLAVKRDGALVYGPGIGDNCTGLAGLLLIARALNEHRIPHAADIFFVANVGEEGLGDLRGMRAVVDRFGGEATYVVVEGGLYGELTHQAIGVRRYHIEVSAPGGHSWGGFGAASAIHVLGHLIVAIDGLDAPVDPKTTYNVGIIEGGLSINTIASSAGLWLDLRSEAPEALERLVQQVKEIVREENELHRHKGDSVQISMNQVGDRPAGSIPRSAPIVTLAEKALRHVGQENVGYIVSSTDTNVPLSRGYQAVCLGLTHSGNSHRTDEYIDITYLPAGLKQLLLVALAATD
jgi:acetylornithine deacetylase/succinyl-diaminopimelate desuccinylase-like protein